MANKYSKAKSAAQKAIRKNPKAFIIALVAIILLVAIAFCVLYFGFPSVWDQILGNNDIPVVDESLQLPEGKLAFSQGDLSVHMLDVGQGDCILILFPDGKDMLIDCANYNDDSAIQQRTFDYLNKYVTDGQFDYVMLTHCDSDHVYFMNEVLDKYQVDKIFMPNVLAKPEVKPSTEELRQRIASLDQNKVRMFTDEDTVSSVCYAEFFCAALTEPSCDIILNVDPDESTNAIKIEGVGYTLTFYCPTQDYYDDTGLSTAERKNAISPIGVLEYKGRRIVLTGDSNELNEPKFISRIGGRLDCDILKVGHHGSETSSTSAFLDAITCEYAFISCNKYGNGFNHPRQTTIDRFISRNMAIYRTDNNGNIVFVINTEITVYVQTRVTQDTNRIGLPPSTKK